MIQKPNNLSVLDSEKVVKLFVSLLLYMLSCFLGLWFVLCEAYPVAFPKNFSFFKLINSFFWVCILFFVIPHKKKKSSVFFLYLTFLIQIIPMATIYTVCGGRFSYFNFVCIGFFGCIILVKKVHVNTKIIPINISKKTSLILLTSGVIGLLASVFITNRLPSLSAINIYNVYEIRESGAFNIGKYSMYFLSMVITIIIPFLVAYSIRMKRYIIAILLIGISFILYLYTGNKVYLFSIPVVICCSFWSKSNDMYFSLFNIFCIALFLLTLIAIPQYTFSENHSGLFAEVYSLIGRRVLLEPAMIKFAYDDYFSSHTVYGFHGLLPQFLVLSKSPYPSDFIIGKEISNLYMDSVSNASTGFLGEAVMHFGLSGVLVEWIFFAFIIQCLEDFELKTDYQLTIGAFAFFIYTMNDAPLLGSLIMGPLMMLLILIFLYNESKSSFLGQR